MQEQPSRLDRIEAALEAMQQRMEQFEQRMEREFEHQMALNADFRTRQELQAQEIRDLKEANQIALEREREQGENIRLIAESVQLVISGLRRHASDGHGA